MKFEDIDDFSDSIFSEDPLDNVEGDEEQANEADGNQLQLFNAKDYSTKQDGRKQNSFKPVLTSYLADLKRYLDMSNARALDDKGYFWTIPAKVTSDKLIWLTDKVKQKLATFKTKTEVNSNFDNFDGCYINIKFIK